MNVRSGIFLAPEWFPQSGVMVTWPHKDTDWAEALNEVEACFIQIVKEISLVEKVLILIPDIDQLKGKLIGCNCENITIVPIESNDTWARDHGPITVFIDKMPVLYDFQFNGWGMKFDSFLDNKLTSKLFQNRIFTPEVKYKNLLHFVLEGGSIESDGEGTLLTTENCLLTSTRNPHFSKNDLEHELKNFFGLKRVLWLSKGYLAGDDTDSHIDTLARFCNANTIAYVHCQDTSDEHYHELQQMEEELKQFRTLEGKPYNLVKLPMADEVYDENGGRLPATYANFLIINQKVLVPFYSTDKDEEARRILEGVFPGRKVVGIECSELIRQHGSLHCVTMQLPENVL